jgi:hypothetical protein
VRAFQPRTMNRAPSSVRASAESRCVSTAFCRKRSLPRAFAANRTAVERSARGGKLLKYASTPAQSPARTERPSPARSGYQPTTSVRTGRHWNKRKITRVIVRPRPLLCRPANPAIRASPSAAAAGRPRWMTDPCSANTEISATAGADFHFTKVCVDHSGDYVYVLDFVLGRILGDFCWSFSGN